MASSLESRNYVATANDAASLAAQMFDAQSATDTIPRLYLRALVATTIHELGGAIRQRAGKVTKLDDTEQLQQLAALDKVIELLYPPVVARYKEQGITGDELNRQTNWARGAHRDVRNWIRAGHSLLPLAPVRLTKATLGVTPRAAAPSPGRIKARVERDSKAAMAAVMELAAVDKDAAIAEIRLLMSQLAGQLDELGVKATRDHKLAVAEHLPLRIGRTVFMPSDTQIIRQMENPS